MLGEEFPAKLNLSPQLSLASSGSDHMGHSVSVMGSGQRRGK